MYTPFAIAPWIRDARQPRRLRSVAPGDLAAAVRVLEVIAPRLRAERRAMLQRQALGLAAGGLLPIGGHLLFGWTIWLLVAVVSFDVLMQLLVDEVRAWRAPGRVRSALQFAAQVEISLGIARHPAAPVQLWPASPSLFLQHLGPFAGLALVLALGPGFEALAAVDATGVVLGFAVPLLLRLSEVGDLSSEAPAVGEPDPAAIPQSLPALVLLVFAVCVGIAVDAVLQLHPMAAATRDLLLLAVWPLCCAGFATCWWVRIERARRLVEHAVPPLRQAARTRRDPAAQLAYRKAAIDPEHFWPPSWIPLDAAPSAR